MSELFPISDRARELRERLRRFIAEVVIPGEAEYHAHIAEPAQR